VYFQLTHLNVKSSLFQRLNCALSYHLSNIARRFTCDPKQPGRGSIQKFAARDPRRGHEDESSIPAQNAMDAG